MYNRKLILKKLRGVGVNQTNLNNFLISIKYIDLYNIKKIDWFLANICHETSNLSVLKENLNYSADGLRKTFSKYFKTVNADDYARQPNKIANYVYGGRMGNRPGTEDGSLYIGRGCMMSTGRSQYELLDYIFNKGFLINPDQLLDPEIALESACIFWEINKIDDCPDITAARKKVNGGIIGIEDVKSKLIIIEDVK